MRQALTEDACTNCSCMPLAERTARLNAAEGSALPPSGMPVLSPAKGRSKRRRTLAKSTGTKRGHQEEACVEGTGAKRPRQEDDHPPSHTVDSLASEFAQIKALLLRMQRGAPPTVAASIAPPRQVREGNPNDATAWVANPREDDTLSIAASDSLFTDGAPEHEDPGEGEDSPSRSEAGSQGSGTGVPHEPGLSTAREDLQLALSRLGIEVPTGVAPPPNAFFRHAPQPSFSVPPSVPFITELQSCWADPKSNRRPSQDCRAMGAMANAAQLGLDRMPAVEPAVASLVVSPDEALRTDARCPLTQCRVTDDYLTRSYNTAAQMARVGNSLSHLILALDQSLVKAGADTATQSLSEASLRAFAYMTKDLGVLMSTLTVARRQVWLAQAPLSESCRRTLRALPVVPGQIFGPAAQEALDRSVQANKARRQFTELRRAPAHQPRRSSTQRPAAGGQRSSAARPSASRQGQPQRAPPQPSFREPIGRAPRRGAPARRSSRPSTGRGSRS